MDKHEINIVGVTYQSREAVGDKCFGCAFYRLPFVEGCEIANNIQPCTSSNRADGKAVIWVQK